MPENTEDVVDLGMCNTCDHHVYREIKPFEESIEQWEEDYNIDITEDSIIETHTCCVLDIDLDHFVIKCNKHSNKKNNNMWVKGTPSP